MQTYDAIVIGFGKAGKTLSAKLAASGQRVALIEKDAGMYGGTCINVGCIPSKSLVHSAAQSKRAGGDWAEQSERYRVAIEEKRRLTAMLRGKNYDKVNDLKLATVYNAEARFVAPHRVALRGTGVDLELEAPRIFINTGSTPVLPPIEGVKGNPLVRTSEGMMELEELPKRLAIVGGGYIGMEFAAMYANFGSQVTVLQDGEALLPREDEDIAAEIRKNQEALGISFQLGAKIQKVAGGAIHYEQGGAQRRLEADAILVATGRRPNVDGLNLQAAGIETTPRGAVATDELLRASAPGVWAMGDVAGGPQFTYVSLDDFRIVYSQLGGAPRDGRSRQNVPYSVFLDPAYARVGLNEREARQAGYHVKIAKLPAAAIPKAQVLKNPAGLLKAVIDADAGKILGAMLICEEAFEMINTVKLAIDAGLHYTVLRDQIYTHPTMTEAFNDLFNV